MTQPLVTEDQLDITQLSNNSTLINAFGAITPSNIIFGGQLIPGATSTIFVNTTVSSIPNDGNQHVGFLQIVAYDWNDGGGGAQSTVILQDPNTPANTLSFDSPPSYPSTDFLVHYVFWTFGTDRQINVRNTNGAAGSSVRLLAYF